MASFLLDTDILINYQRRKDSELAWVEEALQRNEVLGICAVTLAEYYSGAILGQDPELDLFVKTLRYWTISSKAAYYAGQYRLEFKNKGVQLAITDTLLAGVAKDSHLTLVTNNLKDFPMNDISVTTPSV